MLGKTALPRKAVFCSVLRSSVLMALVAGMLAGLPESAAALDSTSFGTSIYFDQGPILGNGDVNGAIFQINIGSPTIESSKNDQFGTREARAVAVPNNFEVGILVQGANPFAGVTPLAGALAAAGYTVAGLPVGSLVTGLDFNVSGVTVAPDARSSYEVIFTAFDFAGRFLGNVNIDSALQNGAIVPVFSVTSCPDPVNNCRNGVTTSGTGSSAVLPLSLPVFPGNGIIAELWGFGDTGGAINFLHSATLTGSPPPGVTVTFATGQTFGAAPEPSSLVLLGLGLTGLGVLRYRRSRTH